VRNTRWPRIPDRLERRHDHEVPEDVRQRDAKLAIVDRADVVVEADELDVRIKDAAAVGQAVEERIPQQAHHKDQRRDEPGRDEQVGSEPLLALLRADARVGRGSPHSFYSHTMLL
jgi:hypothetical protein